jgi:hypothetical protein
MKKFVFVLFAVLFILFLCFNSVFAEMIPVLDQSQEAYDAGMRIFSARYLAQTFTAGQSGNLVKVDMHLTDNQNYPLDQNLPATIRILGTTDGIPNGNILWSNGYDNLAKGWFSIDTSVDAPFLIFGDAYAIEIECADTVVGTPDDLWDVQRTGNPYVNGQLFEKRTAGWVPLTISGTSYPNADATFKTYIVEEPMPMVMVFLAISLIFMGGIFSRSSFS